MERFAEYMRKVPVIAVIESEAKDEFLEQLSAVEQRLGNVRAHILEGPLELDPSDDD